MKWFNNFITISGLKHEGYKGLTLEMLENKQTQATLLSFCKILDLGFDDLAISKEPFDDEELARQLLSDFEGAFKFDIKTTHKKYDAKNKVIEQIEFDMRSQESSGTNKLFNISGSIFNVLNNGGLLVIDDLHTSLHPLLTIAITKLFNSKEYNRNNAQLIFATHDTNILNYGNYRRDQIYFVEKNKYGESEMYSLVEYKEVGKTIRRDKHYLEGWYGAIPFISNLSGIITK